MNKTELIEHIAETTNVNKTLATQILNAALRQIVEALKAGEKVMLIDFGTFEATTREARMGRNPKTGEDIGIKKTTFAKFKPGKAFKNALK